MFFENIEDEYLNFVLKVNTNENENIGFLKGNMFENEYVPYKNYTYIKPKLYNQKEKELFKIMEANFAINDYNLYLDLFPNDENIVNKFKKECDKLHKLTHDYEEKYGPLNLDNYLECYKWNQGPWPWDKEDSKYV